LAVHWHDVDAEHHLQKAGFSICFISSCFQLFKSLTVLTGAGINSKGASTGIHNLISRDPRMAMDEGGLMQILKHKINGKKS
jgi:hypothetical protein